jgi:hypothetical protein
MMILFNVHAHALCSSRHTGARLSIVLSGEESRGCDGRRVEEFCQEEKEHGSVMALTLANAGVT